MKKLALYLMIAVAAAACAHHEERTEPQVTDRSTGVAPPSANTGSNTVSPTNPNAGLTGNELHSGVLAKRSVYFDFDSNAVKDEYRGLIQAHSRYLNDHRDQRIRIEGNCDERGSREYNLALGQRRAETVRQAMVLSGLGADTLEAVSYGEERPRCAERTEDCYAANRRGDILVAP